ncbi:hypothetical protein [Methanolapillus millepedarum]|uniref:Uncharacterized protein n=1 Tax=Methanolapillus millepedarum TaxID=3028296 RepID=A0AA96V550_9EURY|nr:hypothetical protein MsAc7_07340 [Methanosarcinaceae archaeon Ac7]
MTDYKENAPAQNNSKKIIFIILIILVILLIFFAIYYYYILGQPNLTCMCIQTNATIAG